MSPNLSVLTFNLYFGRALDELGELVKEKAPDIICVQEFSVNENTVAQLEKSGYELADYSYSFFKHFRLYSVATFYNPKKIEHENANSINLGRSFYELALFLFRLSKTPRSALTNHFSLKNNSSKHFQICNVHLTALQSTNKVRIKQLQKTLDFLNKPSVQVPTIIAGDFNYVYKRKVLETFFQKYNYKEATNSLLYTIKVRFLRFFQIKMKPDYIWYKGMQKEKVWRFDKKISDHFPVMAFFRV